MANLNSKNDFQLKISRNGSVFNAVLGKIYNFYKTKADLCTKIVHAGFNNLFKAETKAAPCYVAVSQGNRLRQPHIQRREY
jgi:hypothetical protein